MAGPKKARKGKKDNGVTAVIEEKILVAAAATEINESLADELARIATGMIDLTDNRNRTVAEIRHLFSKNDGNLGETGVVAWMFEMKGVILIDADRADEDRLMEIALEVGAEDLKTEDGCFEVTTDPELFETVRDTLTGQGIPLASAEQTMVPQSTVALDAEKARQVLRLMDALEDQDDVQNVYSNFDIPDAVMEEVGA